MTSVQSVLRFRQLTELTIVRSPGVTDLKCLASLPTLQVLTLQGYHHPQDPNQLERLVLSAASTYIPKLVLAGCDFFPSAAIGKWTHLRILEVTIQVLS
jgi:hypothetical protein